MRETIKSIINHAILLGAGLLAYEFELDWLVFILSTIYVVVALLFAVGVLNVYTNIHRVPVESAKEYAEALKDTNTKANHNIIHSLSVAHIIVAYIMSQIEPYAIYCGILFALALVSYRFFMYSIFNKFLEE